MWFTGVKLTSFPEIIGWPCKHRLVRIHCISDRPDSTDSSDCIQLISIEQDLCFDRLGHFTVIPETVCPDAVKNRINPVFFPSFGFQHPPCEFGRGVMVIFAVGGTIRVLSIVQEHSCPDDVRITTFLPCNLQGDLKNPQDVIETMDRV